MSIKVTPKTEVTVTDVSTCIEKTTDVTTNAGSYCVDIVPDKEISSVKKEYSIVGDKFYAGTNSNIAPQWLVDMINATVDTSVDNGLTDYSSLVQDVRNAIDSIDVAKNTFVSQINFTSLVDGIIGSRLETLNATYDGKYATILDLDTVKVDSESALASRIVDLKAEFSSDINSRITQITNAYSDADSAFADSLDALVSAFADQESGLSATAEAVTGLQTYVGLDSSNNNPNGFGMLARLETLEKQTDGSVDITSSTHDVMSGVQDPNEDVSDDSILLDALPYVLWTNMSGSGVPSAILRSYTDYTKDPAESAQASILEGTLYTNTNYTDINVDKYYKFNSGAWESIDSLTFENLKQSLRNAHTGDTYIQYDEDGESKLYVRSYKFIKTAVDTDGPAYSTDDDGYTWALVTDSESQAAYALALEARDMADGKVSHFYAWGDNALGEEPTSYEVTTKNTEYVTDSEGNYLDSSGNITTDSSEYVEEVGSSSEIVSADNVVLWFTDGKLYRKGDSWLDKTLVPTIPGNGSYVAVGDVLTVFDPINSDTTNYWFNGTSWQITGPDGVISKSKWFVDLDNAVYNKHGHLALSLNDLSIESNLYADERSLEVENKFSYDSVILIGGKHYKSGFGMTSLGNVQIGTDDISGDPVFSSEFWVNAESFVLKSPSYPDVEARFKVTSTGLTLGIEHTEATRNEVRGEHTSSEEYLKGDIVTLSGSSYIAIEDVPEGTNIQNTTYWILFAQKGESGNAVDYLFTRNESVPENPGGSDTWYTGVNDVPPGAGELWSIKSTTLEGSVVYSDKRIIEDDIVREILLYSYAIEISSSLDVPTDSKYNFSTGSLTVGDTNWSQSLPSVLHNNHKILVCTALVTGNRTETAKDVVWSIPTVYSQRVDGGTGSSGGDGEAGSRGTAVFTHSIDSTYETPEEVPSFSLSSYWNLAAPDEYKDEINGDTLVLTNTDSVHGWTHIFTYSGVWEPANVFTVNGSQIVNGTIVSEHLVAGSVTADKLLFNSSYLTTENGLLSIASLTDSDSVKLSGDSSGTETLTYVIPPKATLLIYGAFNVYGTTSESSSVAFNGQVTKTDSNVIVSSSLSTGLATGVSSIYASPQFSLNAFNNHSTESKTCKMRINLTATDITGADSSITYMYMILKR